MTSTGISHLCLLFFVLPDIFLQHLVSGQVNVALNKATDQSTDLNFNGFEWTSEKAVDGCDLRDDSENQACCSCTQEDAFGDNFWSVDLGQQYSIQTIIVLGRSDTQTQLENFQLFRQETEFDPELLVYNSLGVEYGDGNFTIQIDPPVAARFIVIRRPGILTLCEVLVFSEIQETSTEAATTEQETTSMGQETTEVFTSTEFSTESPTTTTESGCPPFTYGEFCIACGNCFNNEACDQADGSCPSGCAAGYFGTTCTLGCPGGLYGPDCLNVCGQCFLDAVCNAETGTCPLGCDPGYITSQCDQPCPEYSYGMNCESFCGNCLNADPCNNVDGVCPSGCAPGWEGALCDTLTPTTTTTVLTSTGTTEESVQESNIALGKPASQFTTLDYLFFWTAEKAVDGCSLRDDPDNQQCCSATEGGFENFWTVDLQQQYLVSRIVVTGRTSDFSTQLEDFIVFTQQDEFSPELQVYNNALEGYGDGIFTINLEFPSLVQFVTIRRPSGSIMVICEVEVFGVLPVTTTTLPTTTSTTIISTEATTDFSTITTTTSTEPSQTSSTAASTEGSTNPPITVNTNIAFNKPASQFSTLDYIFLWTADKAVDGCLLNDDPDNQQCCSATEGGAENFWTVDLGGQFFVYQIVITGRTPESSNQLEGFVVYTRQEESFPELTVYDNTGQPYGNGTFILDIPVPSLVQFVTIRRPSGFILVLCEVEVYAIPNEPTTTTTVQTITTSTEAPTTTTEPCPINTYGDDCTPCGNCSASIACNTVTGECPIGCAAGWQPPLCNTECVAGIYGNDCLQTCGNCQFGVPCDVVTGACPGTCDPGWEGVNCDSVIPTTTMTSTTTVTEDQTTSQIEESNIALGKPASQFSTLDYLFFWTADKAVDGCTLRDDPDNQQCCSATEGGFENFWTVDLQQQYLVSRIVVTGRTSDFSTQLEDFIVFTQQDEFSPELQVYNNALEGYGDGIFTINLEFPSLVQFVTIRRPSGSIMVICEVEVFGVIEGTTTTSIVTTTLTTTTTTTTTTMAPTSTTDTVTVSPTSSSTEDSSTATEITDQTNIAFNKPASQFSTLDYFFLWTADKAVDGCTLRDDPDNQQCCSATEGGFENFWTVDLQQQYLVYRIIVTGRTPESSNQLENFEVYTRQESFFPELLIYSNNGQPYGNGTFVIDIPEPSLVQFVTVKRPTGSIIVLCEVEVFALIESQTTTTLAPTTKTTSLEPTTTEITSTSTTSVTTSTESCPTNTYGEGCTPCGNCLTIVPCNVETGECNFGCQAGWQPPMCDTACDAGTYGFDCLEICGNCQFGVPCDVITGACPGTCDPGWEGVNCDSALTSTTSSTSISTTVTSETSSTQSIETNIALGKPATQFSTVDYIFLWTADKAVDGCTLRDDPDNQQCCSATQGDIFENFWSVNLQDQYLVSRIVVTGRTADNSVQLEGFQVLTKETAFSSESLLYDNSGAFYNDGIFDLAVEPPRIIQEVVVRRLTGDIIVLCEIEVFGVLSVETTTPIVGGTDLPSTTSAAPTTTCPTNTWGDTCSPCGSCLTFLPCDATTGECSVGCLPGWQPPLCDTSCSPGFYGIDCLQACGNCQFGVPCDVITGACPGGCDSGWEGINCDSAITTTTSTEATTTTSEVQTTTEITETNIALGKPATQFSTVDYIFLWTADKAVDGCTLRDDPDNQQCCSATQGDIFENFWRVDLQQQYLVSRIVVIGRTPENSGQLEGFTLYTSESIFSSESILYNNGLEVYDDGIFEINVEPSRIVQVVTVRRPTDTFIVLCEVEVFGVPYISSSSSITDVTTTTVTTDVTSTTVTTDVTSTTVTTDVTSTTTATTVLPTTECPSNTWGDACTPCGNCVTFIPCDTTTGECSVGCLPGWQPPLCDTPCSAGFYGVDCSQTCGNCQFGAPCDVVAGACLNGCDPGWEGINCDSAITTSTSTEATTTTTEVQTTTEVTETNIALGKPATQFSTVDYIFLWTADKAVDGCKLRDDPDNQQCCSATQGDIFENFWRVDLQQQYLVSRIVVIGRTPENSGQLEGFTLYTSETIFSSESILYNNGLEVYDDGIFEINVEPPRIVQVVTVRRPTDTFIVLCEVEVFGVPYVSTTSSTTDVTTATTTDLTTTISTTTVSTTPFVCPPNTYGDECTPCGNCLTFNPCNSVTGICPIACAAGWQPPLCNTPCKAGSYGIDCLLSCGNCQFGVPCNTETGACPGACDIGWEGVNCDSAITTAPTTESTTTTQEPTTTTEVIDTNIALGKPASQFSTLDYLFFWTADKAVDGCTLRDDPDNQQCCSATEGGFENFWTVDLEQQYLVSRIVVTGRLEANSAQLEGFQLFTSETQFSTEILLYDNAGDLYSDGIFAIDVNPQRVVQTVTIRRPTSTIIVICEVEVFGVLIGGSTTLSTTTIAEDTTSSSASTSVQTSDASTQRSTMSSSSITSVTSIQTSTEVSSQGPTSGSTATSSQNPTSTASTLESTQATTTGTPAISSQEPTTGSTAASSQNPTSTASTLESTQATSTGTPAISSQEPTTGSTATSSQNPTSTASTLESTQATSTGTPAISSQEPTTGSTAMSTEESTIFSTLMSTQESTSMLTTMSSDDSTGGSTSVEGQQTTQSTSQGTSQEQTVISSTDSSATPSLGSTLGSSFVPTQDDAEGPSTGSTQSLVSDTTVMSTGVDLTTSLNFTQYDGSAFIKPTLAVLVTSILLTIVCSWTM